MWPLAERTWPVHYGSYGCQACGVLVCTRVECRPKHRMPDIRKIRNALAKCVPLKATYHVLRPAAISAVCHVSPGLLTRIRHRIGWDRWPDLRNPTTFDEKLLWLNLYWRHPLKAECADKYGLRGYA